MKKNQANIDAVRAFLAARTQANNVAIMAGTGLTKGQVTGAIRALAAAGALVSEGATLSRMHRLLGDGETPPPSATRRKHKTAAAAKKTRKTARTRTPRKAKAEASPASTSPALDIAMDDAGRVRLARDGAPPFILLTPEDHARLHAFLDRMEPVWSAP